MIYLELPWFINQLTSHFGGTSMEMVNIPPLQMVLGDGVFMALFYLRRNGMDNDYTITVNSGGEPFKREGLLG